jgi:hypothetical protein
MYKFSRPLLQALDPATGLPVFGFECDEVFVFRPNVSVCGRFTANPQTDYGISLEDARQLVAINNLLDEATQAGLNEMCLKVQQGLGISQGDVAGRYFSGPDNVRAIAQTAADYIQHELAMSATG